MGKKPILFEAACIFSMTGSGVGFLTMLFSVIFYKYVTGIIIQLTNITAAQHLSPVYFASLMAAFCISFAGTIKLYRMQRAGLYFYLIAQITILIIPVIWLGNNAFSTENFIFTMLFSGVYLAHFKLLS